MELAHNQTMGWLCHNATKEERTLAITACVNRVIVSRILPTGTFDECLSFIGHIMESAGFEKDLYGMVDTYPDYVKDDGEIMKAPYPLAVEIACHRFLEELFALTGV